MCSLLPHRIAIQGVHGTKGNFIGSWITKTMVEDPGIS